MHVIYSYRMDSSHHFNIKDMLEELIIYSALMVIYVALILNLLVQPIYNLYLTDTLLYTSLALALIVGQGVAMEAIATYLKEKIERD